MSEHVPVMLAETLEYLAVREDGVYVDTSLGLAGHAIEIARRLGPRGRLIARDADGESMVIARERLKEFEDRVIFDHGKFSELRPALKRLGIRGVDGLLADCGVSRYQLTSIERGFSFDSETMDMRLDRSSDGPTAYDIVNTSSEVELAQIYYQLGEERRARRAARATVRARPILDTHSLAQVIESALPPAGKLRSSTRCLQGLRIAVNRELEELEALMEAVPEVMNPGGRVVTITFHSLESRIVKKAHQSWARAGLAKNLTKHVVPPSDEEVRRNAASRSAMLRASEWQMAADHRQAVRGTV